LASQPPNGWQMESRARLKDGLPTKVIRTGRNRHKSDLKGG